MNDYRVRVSLRDPDSDKYVGRLEAWEKAEAALKEAVKALDVEFEEEIGEAAFYGPKIDFVVKDVIGREWQLGTVQVDYNLPKDSIFIIGSDNQNHRPVMIHRAPFDRWKDFAGYLLNILGGNFPTWLAPEQVRIIPVNDDLNHHAHKFLNILSSDGIRASVDEQSAKLGAKIRKAENDKIPHICIIGKKRSRRGKNLHQEIIQSSMEP